MILTDNDTFAWPYEKHLTARNGMWANPEDAIQQGVEIGQELFARFAENDSEIADDSPEVRTSALEVLGAALKVVNHGGLPTERRAHILHGVINALETSGALGGEIEWVQFPPSSSSAT